MKQLLSLFLVCFLLIPLSTHAQTTIKAQTDPDIARFRKGTIVVYAEPGAKVGVRQTRHEFHFGAAVSSGMFGDRADPAVKENYLRIFSENFNSAVFENAMKWPQMQRAADQPVNYTTVDSILAFCDENRIPIRGHNIYWGIPNNVPAWLKEMDDATLYNTLHERGRTLTARYKGRITEYDVNNEMLHGDYFAERLGADIERDMFLWAKEGDPGAIMYLNDYDVLTGNYLARMMAQIRDFKERGIPVGGIGVQGHLHADTFEPAVLKACLDSLATFGLPITITEFNMPGQRFRTEDPLTPEAELRKAENIVNYYRICFANPQVEGILFWGFWEGALWLPTSALWARDFTPLPAAEAYRDLVFDEWWTTWEGTADAEGRCVVPAFFGEYDITVGARSVRTTLPSEDGFVMVDMR